MTIFTATAAFLDEAATRWSDTPDQRWLRERSAAIAKAHAEMLAERAADQSISQENDHGE